MKKIYADELKNYLNKDIVFSGFVDSIRDTKWVVFLVLRDSLGKVQVTIEKNDDNKELLSVIEGLTCESTLEVEGKLIENEKVRLGGIEIIPTSINITSLCDEAGLPFNYNKPETANFDTRLDYRFIDLRNEKNYWLFKIQSEVVKYLREYLDNNGFLEIHTPKFIGSASESGSEVFEVKYFDRKAYLAQSPQFYKQMAMASGMNKIFEVAPCFRAENSNTSRHATEFTSFDVEFAYIDSFDDVMNLEAEMITYALNKVSKKYGEMIKELFDTEIVVPKKEFPKMTLKDVYDELEKRYDYKVDEGEKNDLTTEAERLCFKLAMDKFDSEFLFVTDYPAEKRAFYHMRNKDGVLQGYDLIWRGVEITSGAQREHRYEEIVKNAKEKGLTNDVKDYLEFFKYGCPPHGGFAIGVDRFTMLLLNIPSVKEAMFLFRGPNRLNP